MIQDYLPKKKEEDMVLIQGLVPKELLEQVRAIKAHTGWTWDEILTAFCKDFVREFGDKHEK